jgi:ADP-ribosyl-[dinitrogen reductase] hydrolase
MSMSRSQGCFLGLAIGDALGAPVEFSTPGSFEQVTGYRAGGVFNLEAGQWTDDSSMALCLADSLLSEARLNPADQMERYWRWFQHGENSSTGRCFDIGNGTRAALERWRQTGVPEAGGSDSLGNGALMRMAPVAITWRHDPGLAGGMAARSAQTTHNHPLALASAQFFGEMLARALQGAGQEELLAPWWKGSSNWDPDATVQRIANGSWRDATIRASGHALRSLEAALWAFGSTDCFEACLLAAVNLGDDADTVGAIAGQLAGAHYGLEAIPKHLVSGLQEPERFLSIAERLHQLIGAAST